jgi:hypothetical protein
MAEAFLVLQVDTGDGAQDAVDIGVVELLQLFGTDEVRRAADVAGRVRGADDGDGAELGGGRVSVSVSASTGAASEAPQSRAMQCRR